MFTDLKARIQEIEARVNGAIEGEEAAREAYLENRSEVREDFRKNIKIFQEQLEEAQMINDLLPQRLVRALLSGDKDAQAATEKEIIEMGTYIKNMGEGIEELNRTIPKGHPALYTALLEANDNKAETLRDAAAVLHGIKAFVACLMGDLATIQKSIDLKLKSVRTDLTCQCDEQLTEIMESFERHSREAKGTAKDEEKLPTLKGEN